MKQATERERRETAIRQTQAQLRWLQQWRDESSSEMLDGLISTLKRQIERLRSGTSGW